MSVAGSDVNGDSDVNCKGIVDESYVRRVRATSGVASGILRIKRVAW
jgi:hypothetical protein